MNRGRNVPRVGFLGVGWIGTTRLQALAAADLCTIAGICDPDPVARGRALEVVPGAAAVDDYDGLLGMDLDGVVIATPSGLHADQCLRAFGHGAAVFCQKPLARSLVETNQVLAAAQRANRLLRVDFCYRETRALRALRDTVREGSLGRIYAGELVFHNAYGPDQRWAQDLALAGGGCLMDLGVHLVDATLWVLDSPRISRITSRLFRNGEPLDTPTRELEDFAVAQLELSSGAILSLACSWRSSFGDHARIRLELFGTKGGVVFENVAGSFHDFHCDRYAGASRESLVSPPDQWGERAIVAWARQLAQSPEYEPAEDLREVARTIDQLYGRTLPMTPARSGVTLLAPVRGIQ